MAAGEDLAGTPVAAAEDLGGDVLAVAGGDRPPEAGGRQALDLRGGGVDGLPGGGLGVAAPEPEAALMGQGERVVPGRDEEGHGAGPVEPAGVVAMHRGRDPGLAAPHLPGQRRAVGVDAEAEHRRLHLEPDDVAGQRMPETEVEGVAGAGRLRREAADPAPGIAQLLPGVLVAVEPRRGEQGEELGLGDVQVVIGHEHHRLAARFGGGGHLGAEGDGDRLGLRGGEPEREPSHRRLGREQLETDEVEELRVEAVRHLVEAVQEHVGHPGEQLDERHARVGQVVVGPLRAVARDETFGFVDDVLEPPVVEVGSREAHGARSSGMT